jgi:hypothetical protein
LRHMEIEYLRNTGVFPEEASLLFLSKNSVRFQIGSVKKITAA